MEGKEKLLDLWEFAYVIKKRRKCNEGSGVPVGTEITCIFSCIKMYVSWMLIRIPQLCEDINKVAHKRASKDAWARAIADKESI